VATRDARKEAAHRRQLITAAADASAEVYKLRAEGKKVAVELRKQRRAHGVAAIHANLAVRSIRCTTKPTHTASNLA